MECDDESILRDACEIWLSLDERLRRHVASFLSSAERLRLLDRCAPYVADQFLPTSLAEDVARGGIRLRAAFPKLSRRVASVMREESRIVVRVACDGRHHGSFFEILAATGRHVSFEVTHVLVLRGADLVEDHVNIDFREVARQLARSVECIGRSNASTERGDMQSTRLRALVGGAHSK